MAIYIQITKQMEDDDSVVYVFGPSEKIVGAVWLDKRREEFELIGIDEGYSEEFYMSRVCRKLAQHFVDGELPAHTCYAA